MSESPETTQPLMPTGDIETLRQSLIEYTKVTAAQVKASADIAANSAKFNVLLEQFSATLKDHDVKCEICRKGINRILEEYEDRAKEREERANILTNFWKPILLAVLGSGWVITVVDYLVGKR